MIVSKEDYELTEDSIKVLLWDEKEEYLIMKLFQVNLDKPLTLDDIRESCSRYSRTIKEITVIAENPLNGRMLRYNPLTDNWSLVGTLCGYA